MLAGGEGIFQTSVKGRGRVVVHSQGPIQVIDMVNDMMTVDGSFAVARDASLNFETKLLGKGMLSKVAGGEGFVNIISGTGRLYLAPVPKQADERHGCNQKHPRSRMIELKLNETVSDIQKRLSNVRLDMRFTMWLFCG